MMRIPILLISCNNHLIRIARNVVYIMNITQNFLEIQNNCKVCFALFNVGSLSMWNGSETCSDRISLGRALHNARRNNEYMASDFIKCGNGIKITTKDLTCLLNTRFWFLFNMFSETVLRS